jgi:hypothetical protein
MFAAIMVTKVAQRRTKREASLLVVVNIQNMFQNISNITAFWIFERLKMLGDPLVPMISKADNNVVMSELLCYSFAGTW